MDWFPIRASLTTAALGAALAFAAPADATPTVPTAPSPDALEAAAPLVARPDTIIRRVSSRNASAAMTAERAAMVSSMLRVEGQGWLGIPYRWGGTTRRGIDCSSFVQQFVQSTLAIDLPRATAGQRYEGVAVEKDELLPGDLVFFRRRGVRHVGVYLGEGDFIHASSSRGVTVSNLSESYYERTYWMSRRILEMPTLNRRPTPRAEARRAPADTSSGVRTRPAPRTPVRALW